MRQRAKDHLSSYYKSHACLIKVNNASLHPHNRELIIIHISKLGIAFRVYAYRRQSIEIYLL